MRKLINIFVLCMLMVGLTGCARYNCDMKISGGGRVEINEILAYNSDTMQKVDSYLSQAIDTNFEKETEYLKKWDYKVTDYYESPYNGVVIRKKIPNMNSFKIENMPYGFISTHATPVVVTKGFFKNKYVIEWKFDPKRMKFRNPQAEMEISGKRSKSSGKSVRDFADRDNDVDEIIEYTQDKDVELDPNESDLELNIKLPSNALEDNAKEALGTTYTWTLAPEGQTEVSVVWEAINFGNILGVLIFLIVIGLMGYQMANPKPQNNPEL